MTKQSKEEKKETEMQPTVPNWTFTSLPDKFTQPVPVSSQSAVKNKKSEKKQRE